MDFVLNLGGIDLSNPCEEDFTKHMLPVNDGETTVEPRFMFVDDTTDTRHQQGTHFLVKQWY